MLKPNASDKLKKLLAELAGEREGSAWLDEHICYRLTKSDWIPRDEKGNEIYPPVTTTMEAATDLIWRVFPDASWMLFGNPNLDPSARISLAPVDPDAPITDGRSWSQSFHEKAPTFPLAICAALLQAKIAVVTRAAAASEAA